MLEITSYPFVSDKRLDIEMKRFHTLNIKEMK